MRLLLISVAYIAWATSSVGGVQIGLYSDPSGQVQCLSTVSSPGFEILQAYVVVTGDVPLSSVSFTANLSASGSGYECPYQLLWIGDSAVFPETFGSSPAGVQIDFGECLTPPIHVLTINIASYGLTECCCSCVNEAQGVDCAGQPVALTTMCTRVVPGPCQLTAPASPSPADGATNVALDATLAWTSSGAKTCFLGEILSYTLYFGTSPEPPMIGFDVGAPFDPGELSMGTTYYWRVLAWQLGYGWSEGPLWRFQTEGAVPVESATWGRIKALYEQ